MAAQGHQLAFGGVNFEPIGAEPSVKGGQNAFHVRDDTDHFGFLAAYY